MTLKTLFLLLGAFCLSLPISAQTENTYHLRSPGGNHIFSVRDLTTGDLTDLATLNGVVYTIIGASCLDKTGGRYFTRTNLGIVVIDIDSGTILNTIPTPNGLNGLKQLEYDPNSNKLYGTYWTGSAEILSSVDLTTNTVSDIGVINGVTLIYNSTSTFDIANGRFIFSTNLGVTLVDINNANVLATFDNPNNIKLLEYDSGTNKVFGSYWSGGRERFASIDLGDGTFDSIKRLTGVTSIHIGSSTFDSDGGRYIFNTNLGHTVVDINTGNILLTLPLNSGNEKHPEFGIGSIPLPVELSAFSAQLNAQQVVELYWETSSELHHDYFLIERSADGQQWESIAKQSKATTVVGQRKSYHSLDPKPLEGTSFYRLQQVDLNGQKSFSRVVAIERSRAKELSVFPNPAVDQIELSQTIELGSFELYSLDGRSQKERVQLLGEEGQGSRLDISQLAPSTYFLHTAQGVVKFYKR